ncbi:MAG: endopeptidase La [bacterium]|nr:endopeptidase La [bacterium]
MSDSLDITKTVPDELLLVPVNGAVPLPGTVQQIDLNQETSQWLQEQGSTRPLLVALVPTDESGKIPAEPSWPLGGASGIIRQVMRLPDGGVRVIVQPLLRIRILRPQPGTSPLHVPVEALAEIMTGDTEEQALAYHLLNQLVRYVDLTRLPEPLKLAARQQQARPGVLADLIASNVPAVTREKQLSLLLEVTVRTRIVELTRLLEHELSVIEMGQEIHNQVQQKFGQHQREHILREQMRAIQRELGTSESDDGESLRTRVESARLPEEAGSEVRRELARLESMPEGAAEASVARTYIDWVLAMPWNKRSAERTDIDRAKRVLDEDHEGLDKIKERILEYVAVRKLRGPQASARGPVLLLVGPPGVGKTSLGRSVARALGRKFVRLSLGGVHDEAEIRGHRRTYVGAMPGRLVQALRKAGTANPVIQLDEVDKVGADHRGDPSSALLEVLDPEQNHAFVDHYLDVPVDLSQVIFLATANRLDTIPAALRDRMEVLQLSGYSEEEKVRIARRHLLPKQMRASGLGRRKVVMGDDVLLHIVRRYTREAGLRDFERELAHVGRKLARRVVEGGRGPFRITTEDVHAYLGSEKVSPNEDLREDVEAMPGLVAGLAWTPAGGEVMYIEATRMTGEGLRLTGQLGDVMKESAQIALSYVRSHAEALSLREESFAGQEIHIHLPAGAVPKDGPSAGVALATALVSLLSGVPVRGDVAMTGEVTLRGRVLPVGGIQEKVLAARRAGMTTVILPRRNERDLSELPATIHDEIEFVLVDDLADVIATSLISDAEQRKAA